MMVNRPVSAPTVYAGPVAGSAAAPQPVSVAVNSYQAPSVAGAQPGIMSVLGGLFSGIVNFFKGIFGKLFAPANGPATGPVVTTPTPTQPQTPTTTGPDDATLAAQFGLAPDAANVAAFKQTIASQTGEPDSIGPGSTNTEAVKELQQLLSGWGYPVPATGQFDPATADAVMQFKTATGLTENFKFANGSAGVTPFIDNRTRAKMLELLQANQAPAQPAAPAPTPGTTQAPAPTPTPATPTPAGALSAEEAKLAQDFGIAASRANFDAFMAEAGKLEQEAGVVGPNLNATPEAVQELQTILGMWGYAVTVTGQFDAATVAAVNQFKRSNGISYNFQMADGSAGVHPYIDQRTKDVMIKKLGG